MASPTGGDLYVSRPLTNISVAYMNNQDEFIASKVFPSVPVDHQYGQYYKYTKGDWFKTVSQKRAPRTESAGTGWNITTDTYAADVWAVHIDIADQDRANQDSPIIELDRDATVFVTRDQLLRREKEWLDTYFRTGQWTLPDMIGAAAADATHVVYWNRTASTPIEDIEAKRMAIARTTGQKPNVLVLGPETESALKNNAEILARILYTERGIVTRDLLAALFDVDEVLVPVVVENTAREGATDAFSFVQGKSALLAHRAARPSRLTPSAGYGFEWTGYIGAADRGTRVKKFRMEQLAADRVEAEMAFDYKLVSPDLAQFFSVVVE